MCSRVHPTTVHWEPSATHAGRSSSGVAPHQLSTPRRSRRASPPPRACGTTKFQEARLTTTQTFKKQFIWSVRVRAGSTARSYLSHENQWGPQQIPDSAKSFRFSPKILETRPRAPAARPPPAPWRSTGSWRGRAGPSGQFKKGGRLNQPRPA